MVAEVCGRLASISPQNTNDNTGRDIRPGRLLRLTDEQFREMYENVPGVALLSQTLILGAPSAITHY